MVTKARMMKIFICTARSLLSTGGQHGNAQLGKGQRRILQQQHRVLT
jgi:hypothetical protein